MTLGKTDDSTESRAAASQEAIDPPVRLRQPQSGNGRIAVAQRLMDGGSIPPSSTIIHSRQRRQSRGNNPSTSCRNVPVSNQLRIFSTVFLA